MKIVSPKDNTEISKLFKTDSNIILDFYADWCGPCKVLARSFEEISNENMFNDITLIKIDIAKFTDLSRIYNVRSLPHVVYTTEDSDKERINLKIKVGSMNKSDLIEMIGKIYEK
tara:strand:- start:768 stop:1112 length:345 start_codon:yes stop_codon:yes gene_type:complete